jgi:serine protease Do
MNKKLLFAVGGTAALAMVLVALPGRSNPPQVHVPQEPSEQTPEALPAPPARSFSFSIDGGGSWLGVEPREVTGEKARELKLPAERGVLLGKIMTDSPASKAGLRENDVVTEINGQRVEGASQFHRMIREIPAGRTIQLTVWRDGRAQQISVTLGKSENIQRDFAQAAPGAFAFRMPDIPELPEIPDFRFDDGTIIMNSRPRLGIDAEDLSGQLGSFFGAPEGEGILVREVTSGSAAEKAGVKAGDVIVSLNGERMRSLGDLRGKLAGSSSDKPVDKPTTVTLGVVRNHSQMTVTLELPPPNVKAKHLVKHEMSI